MEKINILIVHYNTPYLTECLVKSINKFVGTACTIYIFDNSDEKPFTYKQDNIVVFDNTKWEILNFKEMVKSYTDKEYKKTNFITAKHCYTIEKCVQLIPDGFVLLDSDVLLKKDIKTLFNDKYVCIADIDKQHGRKPRFAPFICYINSKYLIENNLHYFNPKKTIGLSNDKQLYDTGAVLYEEVIDRKLLYKKICMYEYVEHYGSASWTPKWGHKMSVDRWLRVNQKYYILENYVK